MKHRVSFSGWGQPAHSVLPVIPGAVPFDYMRYGSVEECFGALAAVPCDVAVGWSLGGQVAIRAVACGIIRPQLLVLLATPFRFVHPYADIFAKSVAENPENAIKRFSLMMSEGDSNRKMVLRALETAPCSPHISYWLNQLYAFDCSDIDFRLFPPTLILHGRNDSIVQVVQAEELARNIPESRVIMLEEAAHVPHLHDSEMVRKLIESYVA